MKTCKTCKWWTGTPETGEFNPAGFRECKCPKVTSENNDPDDLVKRNNAGDEWTAERNDICWASAHDYYQAEIVTGPNFGCIHHEEKT